MPTRCFEQSLPPGKLREQKDFLLPPLPFLKSSFPVPGRTTILPGPVPGRSTRHQMPEVVYPLQYSEPVSAGQLLHLNKSAIFLRSDCPSWFLIQTVQNKLILFVFLQFKNQTVGMNLAPAHLTLEWNQAYVQTQEPSTRYHEHWSFAEQCLMR